MAGPAKLQPPKTAAQSGTEELIPATIVASEASAATRSMDDDEAELRKMEYEEEIASLKAQLAAAESEIDAKIRRAIAAALRQEIQSEPEEVAPVLLPGMQEVTPVLSTRVCVNGTHYNFEAGRSIAIPEVIIPHLTRCGILADSFKRSSRR